MPVDAAGSELEKLARKWLRSISKSDELGEAEKRLLHGAPKGDTIYCGPSGEAGGPADNPANCNYWGKEREIRQEILTWLCTDREASKYVYQRGISVHGAKFTGRLGLAFSTIPFLLELENCCLTDEANLNFARISQLYLLNCQTRSLIAEGVMISGNLLVQDTTVVGEVRLIGAQIGGTMNCERSSFSNPSDYALNADRIKVQGALFLRRGFRAQGVVSLSGARIGGDLSFRGAKLGKVYIESASVEGNLFVDKGFEAGWLDLIGSSVAQLNDDRNSWPAKGTLVLDGFVYRGFGGPSSPVSSKERLEWLDRQSTFRPQPYMQLAKVLREEGDEDGGKEVLYELARRADTQQYTLGLASRIFVGYGLYPMWAVYWLGGLSVLGWVVHRRAKLLGVIAQASRRLTKNF